MTAQTTTPAPTFKLIGENVFTGNTWDCETGLTAAEVAQAQAGYQRLESDYKIMYCIRPEVATA